MCIREFLIFVLVVFGGTGPPVGPVGPTDMIFPPTAPVGLGQIHDPPIKAPIRDVLFFAFLTSDDPKKVFFDC